MLSVGYLTIRGDLRECRTRQELTYSGIGVFVGVEPSGIDSHLENANVFSVSGSALSITSGRLSYTLGLIGPCYSVDTACSSALAALHLGSTALVMKECEEGVAMGTKALSEQTSTGAAMGGMISPRG